MNNNGFIQLHRKLINWEWYSDIPVRLTFIHLLIIANWENKNWKGINIKRGQVIIGRKKLSKEIGISERQLRTALTKLKSTSEIATKTTNKFTVLTLIKYEDYQNIKTTTTSKTTSNESNERPTNDQQTTTTKEYNNIINKENKKGGKNFRFSPPTISEIEEYIFTKTGDYEIAKKESQKFYNFYNSKNWMVGKNKMKKWKSAVSNWLIRLDEWNKEKSSAKKESKEASQEFITQFSPDIQNNVRNLRKA